MASVEIPFHAVGPKLSEKFHISTPIHPEKAIRKSPNLRQQVSLGFQNLRSQLHNGNGLTEANL